MRAYIDDLTFWMGERRRPLLQRSLKLKVDIIEQKSRLPTIITVATKEYLLPLLRILSTSMPLWYLYVLSTGQVWYAEPYNAFSIAKRMTCYVYCALIVNWTALQNILKSSSYLAIVANLCVTINMLEMIYILFSLGFNKLGLAAILIEWAHIHFHDVKSWGLGTYTPSVLGTATTWDEDEVKDPSGLSGNSEPDSIIDYSNQAKTKPKGLTSSGSTSSTIKFNPYICIYSEGNITGSTSSTIKFNPYICIYNCMCIVEKINFNDAFSYICNSSTMQFPFIYLSVPWMVTYMIWVTTAAMHLTYDFGANLSWCQGFWMTISFFIPVYEAVKTGDLRRWGSLRIVILAWLFFLSDLIVCYNHGEGLFNVVVRKA